MFRYAVPLFLTIMASCSNPGKDANAIAHDIHSYGNPEQARVRHLNLDLEVLFDQLSIRGTAVLTIDRLSKQAKRLVLDSRALQIDEAEISPDGARYREARFDIGKADPILGAPLDIDIAPDTRFVRIRYSTSPSGATALQWLTPEQTEGKRHPFLYTQSQAIHARSWIPLQDSRRSRHMGGARQSSGRSESRDERDPLPRYGGLQFRNGQAGPALPDRSGGWRLAVPFHGPSHRRVGGARGCR